MDGWCHSLRGFILSPPMAPHQLLVAKGNYSKNRLDCLAESASATGNTLNTRYLDPAATSTGIHPLQPGNQYSIHLPPRSFLADVLASPDSGNMMGSNSFQIRNLAGAPCLGLICMHSPLVRRESGSCWPQSLPFSVNHSDAQPGLIMHTITTRFVWPWSWQFRLVPQLELAMPHIYAMSLPSAGDGSLVLGQQLCFGPLSFLGVCTVSGPPPSINAYCTELYGIYSLLVALDHFCLEHSITLGGVLIGCDYQGTLKLAQQFNEHVPCAHPHTDVIWAITTLHLKSPLQLQFIYIPGHQDALTHFEDLSLLAWLNVWMDSLAKRELHQVASLPVHAPPCNALMGERWHGISLAGKIMADPHSCVINLLGQQMVQCYWDHKQQLTTTSFRLVHWASMGKAMGSFLPTFQMWLSKFASSHSAVAVTMFQWKCWDLELCPHCHQVNETTFHVLLCLHSSSTDNWVQQLGQLCQQMSQTDTAPAIQHCLLSTIEHHNCQSFQSFADPLCQQAACDQD